MEAVAVLDLLSMAAFAAAAVVVLRGRGDHDRAPRRLLATALAVYTFVGLSNVLEHAGLTDLFDVYEDYVEIIFLPLIAMYVYAAIGADEIRRRETSEERYRTLVEGIDLGVTLVGRDHRVIMANSAQGRMLGRPVGSLIGQHCFREFEGRDEICPHCPGVQTMADGRMHETETLSVGPDGKPLAMRIRSFPTVDKDGQVGGFLELVEDITEKRRAEDQRQRLELQAQQNQKLESLGLLAGGIAHDFNNILAGIVGNTELALLAEHDRRLAATHMTQVQTLAERAAELVGQLLAYAGRGSVTISPLDLNAAIEEMLQLLQLSISKKARLTTDLATCLPRVPADAAQIRQVLMNLVINASEALGEREGRIGVGTTRVAADAAWLAGTFPGWSLAPGEYVAIEVSDTGAGMTAEVRARLFDPFFTTKASGRGLGLAAVLGIVNGHRGAIRVTSEEGQGTTFQLLLPTAAAPLPLPQLPPSAPSAAEVWHRGGTVLVVDDEQQVREAVARMMQALGYRVLTAADGRDGVDLFALHRHEVDLVLLDLSMPRLDGGEALTALRALAPEVTVVMVSGFSPEDTARRLAGPAPAAILQKPFTLSRLRATLQALPEP